MGFTSAATKSTVIAVHLSGTRCFKATAWNIVIAGSV